jgi:hypothetical protein
MGSIELEEQLEEQVNSIHQPPEKRPRIDNCQEGINASNPNDSDLPKSAEGDKGL